MQRAYHSVLRATVGPGPVDLAQLDRLRGHIRLRLYATFVIRLFPHRAPSL